MKIHSKLYIGGEWVDPLNPSIFEVVNIPSPKQFVQPLLAVEKMMSLVVAAARRRSRSFPNSVEDRRAMLERIAAGIKARADEFSEAMEHGAK